MNRENFRESLREAFEDIGGYFRRLTKLIKQAFIGLIGLNEEVEKQCKIVVDCDGGDKAPKAIIKGIKTAINKGFVNPEEILVIGTENSINQLRQQGRLFRLFNYLGQKNQFSQKIAKTLQGFNFFIDVLAQVNVLVCDEAIEMDDDRQQIIKKRNSSAMALGIKLIKKQQADALVSAGNTAGMVILGSFILGRYTSDLKPAIAVPLPNDSGPCLLLDAGAIHRATPQDLLNCAIMGSTYAQNMWGIKKPTIRLLNIGSERGKGNEDLKMTQEIFENNQSINYCGNIEGDKIFVEPANVIVCSGEIGNNTIKVAEGVVNLVKEKMGWFWTIISLFWNHHKRADHKEIGGSILLGVKGTLIIAHGKSDSLSIANAIRRAKQEIVRGVSKQIPEQLSKVL